MEKLKRVLGTGVFATLFVSMFFSFMLSLSQNVHMLDVSAHLCPQTQQDVILLDCDDEVASDYKILMEKNVLYTHHLPPMYEVIREDILEPQKPHSANLTTDIFYPPKGLSV